MDKIRLGRTNLMVSRIGFGGIPIQRLTEDEAVTVVKKCLDLGITYIDTANAYTTSERRIGKAIAGRRQELIIATKSVARTKEGPPTRSRRCFRPLRRHRPQQVQRPCP